MSAIALLQWLESPDRHYQKGLQLYEQYGTNSFLKKVLAQGNDPHNRAKLAAAIEKLVSEKPAAPRTSSSLAPVLQKTAAKPDAKDYPPQVTELIEQKNQLFKEASHLQGRLTSIPDLEGRRQAAVRILDSFDRADEIWGKIKYFDTHGCLPPEHVATGEIRYETDPARMVVRLRTLRTYISRDRNNPNKAPKVAAWSKELAHYEKEIGS